MDQQLQHFSQSLHALNVARSKFKECIEDIKTVSRDDNSGQSLLVPLSGSLYVSGKIHDNKKFMVDVGTGYYVDKSAEEAIQFYQKKVDKLSKESVQIQDIIKEKNLSSLAIENQLRLAAVRQQEQIAAAQKS